MFMLGVIPARGGSKGIPRKNLYPLCGKPLIDYTIDAARRSRHIADVVVSTDMEEIFDIYFKQYDSIFYGIRRPAKLARDDTPMVDVVKHVLSPKYNNWVQAVVLLQPTSPLRTTEDIDNAARVFIESGADSLYSGYYMGIKTKDPYDKHKCKPHFQRNGAIFITRRDLLDKGKLWSDEAIEFEMPKSRSIDIDDMDDMKIAEALIKNG